MKRWNIPGCKPGALLLFLGILLLLSCCIRPHSAYAHFNSTGYSDIVINENSIHYDLYLDTRMLSVLFNIDPNQDGVITEEDLTKQHPMFTQFINDYLIVSSNGIIAKVELNGTHEEKRGDLSTIRFDLTYDFPQAVKDYQIDYLFFYDGLDPGHQNFVVIHSDPKNAERVMDQNNHVLRGTVSDASADSRQAGFKETRWWDTLYQYTVMGFKHIWSGYDHLLFLVGLLMGGGSRRNFITMITSFTLGHCLTLTLAALEIVTLPISIIEPLIALSIVYIAIENIFLKSRDWRWLVALLFGLVHGFGFADILRGRLTSDFVLPLFSFNLGVELAQLSVLLICFPLLLYLVKGNWQPRVHAIVSGIVGVIGLYWFIGRLY